MNHQSIALVSQKLRFSLGRGRVILFDKIYNQELEGLPNQSVVDILMKGNKYRPFSKAKRLPILNWLRSYLRVKAERNMSPADFKKKFPMPIPAEDSE